MRVEEDAGPHIVVSPSYIESGVEGASIRSINESGYEREQVGILYSPLVYWAVILCRIDPWGLVRCYTLDVVCWWSCKGSFDVAVVVSVVGPAGATSPMLMAGIDFGFVRMCY
jgi:hypothetical protein